MRSRWDQEFDEVVNGFAPGIRRDSGGQSTQRSRPGRRVPATIASSLRSPIQGDGSVTTSGGIQDPYEPGPGAGDFAPIYPDGQFPDWGVILDPGPGEEWPPDQWPPPWEIPEVPGSPGGGVVGSPPGDEDDDGTPPEEDGGGYENPCSDATPNLVNCNLMMFGIELDCVIAAVAQGLTNQEASEFCQGRTMEGSSDEEESEFYDPEGGDDPCGSIYGPNC